MQRPGPSLGPPAVAGPQRGPVFCFVGTVHLERDAAKRPPGAVIGQLHTTVGVGVPLVLAPSPPLGSATLAGVDQQTATLCGKLLFHDERLALEVAYVSPGVSAVAPGVSPLALVVLALLGLLPTAT